MGLDWVLDKTKPREGSETRFAEIELALTKIRESAKTQEAYEELTEDLREELDGISMSAFEAVGAPRIGHDKRADEWFREHNYDPAHKDALEGKLDHSPERKEFWLRSFEECLKEHKGQYILEAAELEGGVAEVTGIAVGSADFRGKILRFCEGLPGELVNESYENHTGEECVDYADRLEEALGEVPSEEDKKLVRSAAGWLRFWGSKGFGYYAWY